MNRKKRHDIPGPYIERIRLDRARISNPKHYAYQLPAIRHLDQLKLHPKVTFFVGENGSGESTLLEALAIACGLNPEGGSRNMRFRTRESHSNLCEALQVSKLSAELPDAWFLRAESFFNVATEIENLDEIESESLPIIKSYGGISLHEQSHGESFMSLIENRFRQGLFLLDEPEAALSPQRQLQFLILINELVQQKSQLIIATHSPIIMAYPHATIYSFESDGIAETSYQETEHFKTTKLFLDGPERMLSYLLQ